jgi:hypothetical protein
MSGFIISRVSCFVKLSKIIGTKYEKVADKRTTKTGGSLGKITENSEKRTQNYKNRAGKSLWEVIGFLKKRILFAKKRILC